MKRLGNVFRCQVVLLHQAKHIADYFRFCFLFQFIGITLQSSNFILYFGDGVEFFSHAFLFIISQPAKLRGGLSSVDVAQAPAAWLTFFLELEQRHHNNE